MRTQLITVAFAFSSAMWPGLTMAQEPAGEPEQAKPETAKSQPATESIGALEQKAAAARQEEDWMRLYRYSMDLHERRPFNPDYMLNIIRATAAMDRPRTAYHFMLQMQQQGLSYDIDAIPQTAGIRDTEAYEYLNKLMREAGQPAGSGRKVLSVPGSPYDLGDIAWDDTRKRFLVGTRREGELLAVAEGGEVDVLLRSDNENGMWSLDGLAVDEANNALWIASSASPVFADYTPADARRGGLFRFALDSLELVNRYNLPVDGLPHSLGSVAVTANGDVYVIDRAVPVIYRKSAEGERLEHFVALPDHVALTDITATPDSSRLFVSDAVVGVAVIDPNAGQLVPLGGPENLNQFGIYGIDYTEKSLVVTQSGISPQRLMRLTLDEGGTKVTETTPLAVALEGFDTPGVGTIRGEDIFYFANHGAPQGGSEKLLMATPLDSGETIESPDMRVFQEALRERLEREKEAQEQ